MAESFLTAWRRLDDVPSGDATRVWLYATTRHVVANQHGVVAAATRCGGPPRRGRPAASWPATPATGPEEVAVHEALAKLAAWDREVLLLAEWEGLAAAGIAQVLGCLVVTARGGLPPAAPASGSSSNRSSARGSRNGSAVADADGTRERGAHMNANDGLELLGDGPTRGETQAVMDIANAAEQASVVAHNRATVGATSRRTGHAVTCPRAGWSP